MDPFLRALHAKICGLYDPNYDHKILAATFQLHDTIVQTVDINDSSRKYEGRETKTLLDYVKRRGDAIQAAQLANNLSLSEDTRHFNKLADNAYNCAYEIINVVMGVSLFIFGLCAMIKLDVLGVPIYFLCGFIQIHILFYADDYKLPKMAKDLCAALNDKECRRAHMAYLEAHNEYVAQVDNLAHPVNEAQIAALIAQIKVRNGLQKRRNALFKAADARVDRILSYTYIWPFASAIVVIILSVAACFLIF